MCGICGLVQFENLNVSASIIKNMADSIKHRGPDDEGYLAVSTSEGLVTELGGEDSKIPLPRIDSYSGKANLFLGHRRLSIIDLSANGHQPMSYQQNDDCWLVYNGEIYNYKKIRTQLASRGYQFKTRTDSEVLLAAYIEWGEDCLAFLDGMWAFVIYDKRRNVMFGSRDRFGVKPLYFYHTGSCFAFASEAKAFMQLPYFNRAVNEKAVFDYLVFGKDRSDEDETFFSDVRELPPAKAFRLDLNHGELTSFSYYDLPMHDGDRWEPFSSSKAKENIEIVRSHIFDAVRSHLISDVPVGTCLSGGIDSSALVCAISSILKGEQIEEVGATPRVFTACYQGSAIDESKWARLVSDQTGAEWFTVFPSKTELFDDLEDLVYTQDFPFGSTSIYAQYRVMRLARDNGIKVLLDGQGGDELFGGYTPYYLTFFLEMLGDRAFRSLFREFGKLGNAPISRKTLLKQMLINSVKSIAPGVMKQAGYRYRNPLLKYVNPQLIEDYFDIGIEKIKSEVIGEKKLNQKLHNAMTKSSLPNLLRYEDRNSMRFSLESRTPFADHISLIETLFAMPAAYKIHNGFSKWLLREAMKPKLPEKIYSRRDKIGFATPEHEWLNENKLIIVYYLSSWQSDYVRVDEIIKDLDFILDRQPRLGITDLWRFINLALWQMQFNN